MPGVATLGMGHQQLMKVRNRLLSKEGEGVKRVVCPAQSAPRPAAVALLLVELWQPVRRLCVAGSAVLKLVSGWADFVWVEVLF